MVRQLADLTDTLLGHVLGATDARTIARAECVCPRFRDLKRLPMLERRWTGLVIGNHWGREKLQHDLERLGLPDLSVSARGDSHALGQERRRCLDGERCDNHVRSGWCAHFPLEDGSREFVGARLAQLAEVDRLLREKQTSNIQRRQRDPTGGRVPYRRLMHSAECGLVANATALTALALLVAGVDTAAVVSVVALAYVAALTGFQFHHQEVEAMPFAPSTLFAYAPSQTLRAQGAACDEHPPIRQTALRRWALWLRGGLWGPAALQAAAALAVSQARDSPARFLPLLAVPPLLFAAGSAAWHWRRCPSCRGFLPTEEEAARVQRCPEVKATLLVAGWHSAVAAAFTLDDAALLPAATAALFALGLLRWPLWPAEVTMDVVLRVGAVATALLLLLLQLDVEPALAGIGLWATAPLVVLPLLACCLSTCCGRLCRLGMMH